MQRALLGRRAAGRARMSRGGNMGRCRGATWCVAAALLAAAGTRVARAQQSEAPWTTYAQLRAWVDAFDDLPDLRDSAARLPVVETSGICVTLRRSGRVVGSGVDDAGDTLMARRAIGRALSEVLGHPAVANLPPELREGVGRRLTIELEVAAPLVPLLGRSAGELAEQVSPGLDGIAVRSGDRIEVMYPSQMLAINMAGAADRLLPAMARRLGLRPEDDAIWADRDVTAYRFRTTHLTQATPTDPPEQLYRGDRLVDGDVDMTSVLALADGIAAHLGRSRWPDPPGDGTPREPLGLMGTYRPTSDRYEPLVAPPLDQALAALALRRYAATPGAGAAAAANDVATLILGDLAVVSSGERDPADDPTASAVIVLALLETDRDEPQRLLLERSATTVLASFAEGRFDPGIRGPQQAVLAGAAAALLHDGFDAAGLDADVVRAMIDATWSSVEPQQQVALLPWIAWAEADLAAATSQPMKRADELRLLRDLLERSRVDGLADGTADLAGSFRLGRPRSYRASAQSTRPAIFMAWAARQPLLASEDRDTELDALLGTMRYLIQLSVRESLEPRWPNPPRARGGLRTSTWDADQPVAAQGLGLLAAVETLQTIQQALQNAD